MLTPNWSTYITNHPDRNDLTVLAGRISNLIDITAPITTNIHNIQSSPSTVLLTLDPFTHGITPHFHHHQLGLPILGQPTRLIALQGFTTKATPIELDKENLFNQTTNTITTPTLASFLSFHDKCPDQLKTIQTTTTETHHIRKTAVLPPPLIVLLIASKTNCPWTILFQAITIIQHSKPDNITDPDDVAFAQQYLPLLLTLWAFTRSTDETKTIQHVARAVAVDHTSQNWCKEVHNIHIPQPTKLTTQNNTTTDDSLALGINRLTKTLEDQQNDRFATADEAETNGEERVWKKLDPTFKKVIQFASSTDGENPSTEPTTRLIALLKTKNGPLATRLFTQWHTADMVVQTGMTTNITKGCLVCSDGPFAINTFSPFFTPPQRAGFNIMSHDEINSLALLTESHNLTQQDIQKVIQAKPYIPTEPHLFISQVENFGRVVRDILGNDSLVSRGIAEIVTHYKKNELLYYNIFASDKNFAVWFLNQLHFKTQQIFHQCAAAESVMDIQFNHFNMQAELISISTLTYNAKVPLWFADQIRKRDERELATRPTPDSSPYGKKRGPPDRRGSYNDRATIRTTTNTNNDQQTKLLPDERYSFVVHRQNLMKCRNLEVTDRGVQICNNWHIRGWCTDGCRRGETHKPITGQTLQDYRKYVTSLRTEMKRFESHMNGNNRNRGGYNDRRNNYNDNRDKIPFGNGDQKSSTGEK